MAVVEQMWRAVAFVRVATLCYAAVLIVRDHGDFAHPAAGLAVLAAMVAWSAVTIAGYAAVPAVRRWLPPVDVAVAVALVLLTLWVDAGSRIDAGKSTLPSSWSVCAVLACAVAFGPWAGLAGAVAVSAADVAERGALPHATFNGVVLLLIAGTVAGYVVRLGVRAEQAATAAARTQAAAAERERLARDIHDSVLQVLALIHRRGRALGGEAAELAGLAGEQESALRTLVGSAPHPVVGGDLGVALERLAGPRVTVSAPADPVALPDAAFAAMVGAAREALSNVEHHAGPDARAWVLIEDEDTVVTVTVRDDGVGFAAERLAQAAAAGRMGVARSIVGRLRECGGQASVISTPEGTQVVLRVDRD